MPKKSKSKSKSKNKIIVTPSEDWGEAEIRYKDLPVLPPIEIEVSDDWDGLVIDQCGSSFQPKIERQQMSWRALCAFLALCGVVVAWMGFAYVLPAWAGKGFVLVCALIVLIGGGGGLKRWLIKMVGKE